MRIAASTVAEGAILGAVHGAFVVPSLLTAMIGLYIGGIVGAMFAPVSIAALWEKRLERAVAWRFSVSFAAVVVLSVVFGTTLVPMFGTIMVFMVATAVVSLTVEDAIPPPGFCARCGYNLTGNISGVCPECGTRVGSVESSP